MVGTTLWWRVLHGLGLTLLVVAVLATVGFVISLTVDRWVGGDLFPRGDSSGYLLWIPLLVGLAGVRLIQYAANRHGGRPWPLPGSGAK